MIRNILNVGALIFLTTTTFSAFAEVSSIDYDLHAGKVEILVQ